MESHVELPLLFLMVVVCCLYLWSGIWAYQDARKRGKPPLLVALLVLLAGWLAGWRISLLVWIALRPDDGGGPPFNLADYRVR